jgi:hypothetical protein
MLEVFRPGLSLTWDLAWQATLYLSIGLTAAFFLERRPARAHQLLLLAMLAALTAPVLSQVGRGMGWGLWTAGPIKTIEPALAGPNLRPSHPLVTSTFSSTGSNRATNGPVPEGGIDKARLDGARRSPGSTSGRRPSSENPTAVTETSVNWPGVLKGAWLVASFVACCRLLISVILGRRLVRQAHLLWCRLKVPVALSDRACIGRHINEVGAVRAHFLTAGKVGYPIGRDAGVCPKRLERRHQGTRIAVRDRPARNK